MDVCRCGCARIQGAHSPGPRAKSMGVYPIQTIKSRVLDHDDVSEQKPTTTTERTILRAFCFRLHFVFSWLRRQNTFGLLLAGILLSTFFRFV